MAAGSTYTPIATSSPSGTSSVTFSSISSAYTDLIVIYNGIATAAVNINLTYNGDSGSNYSFTRLYGNGSSASSDRTSNTTALNPTVGGVNNQFAAIWQFMNYSNTTTYKTALFRSNDASAYVGAQVGLWRSTSAITSMTFALSGATYSAGTTFTLYGIAAA